MPQPPRRTPEVTEIVAHNRSARSRHVLLRAALGSVLIALPFALTGAGVPNTFLTVLPIVPGLFILLLLLLQVRHGRRLDVCERVLRTYPLEYRDRVDRRGSDRLLLGTVHTVKLPIRGQHGAPTMRALNASMTRRWPEGAASGAWFAGDPAFGGVMVVPDTGDMLFLQPAEWRKYETERDEADPGRRALAEQAGISALLEKEPNTIAALGG
ncbi:MULTISPECIES: hypothetical protein [Streptomyces]|jgi:hypothetical protein|uniref:hypothetical protein n=1 Tax=Streptomyces TaxID=1883 RepID=UPI000A37C09F|nr:hypothetical protein [Streptomyces viridochromogenes]